MNFKYYGREFIVSESREKYNVIKKEFEIKSRELLEKYCKNYDGLKNIDSVLDNIDEIFGNTILSASSLGNKILLNNGISDYSSEKILKEHIKKISKAFVDTIGAINEKYIETIEEDNEKKRFREKCIKNKEKWGFFVEKEIGEKALEMDSINMATSISNEKGNIIGKTIGVISVAYKKKELYKESKENLLKSFSNGIDKIMEITIEILRNVGTEVEFVSEVDKREVENMLKHLEEAEEKKEVLYKCLTINPYNKDIYKKSIDSFGDKDKEIQKLGDYFGIEVIEYKRELIKKYFEELDLKTEEKTKGAKRLLEEKIEFLGTFGNEYIEKIDKKLIEFDIKERTVDGNLFDTREEAALGREELNKIIKIKGNININSEESIDNALIKVNEEEFKTVIKDKYLKELEEMRLKAIRYEDNMLLENRFSLDAVIDEETAILMEEDIQNLILRSKDLVEKRLKEIRDKKEKLIYKEDKEKLETLEKSFFELNEREIEEDIEKIKNLNLRSTKLVEDKIKYMEKNKNKIISNNIKLIDKAERYELKLKETSIAVKETSFFKKALDMGKNMVENIVTSGDKGVWEKITKNGTVSIEEIKSRI